MGLERVIGRDIGPQGERITYVEDSLGRVYPFTEIDGKYADLVSSWGIKKKSKGNFGDRQRKNRRRY